MLLVFAALACACALQPMHVSKKRATAWQRSLPTPAETERALIESKDVYHCSEKALKEGVFGHREPIAGKKGTIVCIGGKPSTWHSLFSHTGFNFMMANGLIPQSFWKYLPDSQLHEFPPVTVAFKGTDADREKHVLFENIKSDALVWKMPLGDHPGWREWIFTGVGEDIAMAYGFKSTYDGDDVEQTLFDEIAQFPREHTLVVTGHSLGGALATIFATRYALIFPERKVRLITFGALRVGDKKFRELTESLGNLAIARLVNEDDIAPRFPLASAGYSHVGHTILVSVTDDPKVNAWTNEDGDGEWNIWKLFLRRPPWKAIFDHLWKGDNGYVNATYAAIESKDWPKTVGEHVFHVSDETTSLVERYRAEHKKRTRQSQHGGIVVGQGKSVHYQTIFCAALYCILCFEVWVMFYILTGTRFKFKRAVREVPFLAALCTAGFVALMQFAAWMHLQEYVPWLLMFFLYVGNLCIVALSHRDSEYFVKSLVRYVYVTVIFPLITYTFFPYASLALPVVFCMAVLYICFFAEVFCIIVAVTLNELLGGGKPRPNDYTETIFGVVLRKGKFILKIVAFVYMVTLGIPNFIMVSLMFLFYSVSFGVFFAV